MKKLFTFSLLVFALNISAQVNYAVELTSKSSLRVEDFIKNPEKMLSKRSLERRERLNIALDSKDVPIDKQIVVEIKNTGATILSSSKWLNTVFVKATDSEKKAIENLSYVKHVKSLETASLSKEITSRPPNLFKRLDDDYGHSSNFIKQINLDYVHKLGFTGNGIQIAVLDAGFDGVDKLEAFKELRDRGGIIGSYNFVDKTENVYKDHYHGTMVLGTMALNNIGDYRGSAYEAKYWLFTTEDNKSETPAEEFNWIAAAEFADSAGVDVINSSLGYNEFNEPFTSYTYDDMDGKTSYVSRGADAGVSRGIIVVISAGNEGNNNWKHIMTPADGIDVLTVGAVDIDGTVGDFSSYGPSADGRIKPNITAMGVSVPVYDEKGKLRIVNGTSFSSPITAGAVACLRQAFPKASVKAIVDALQRKASISLSPNDRIGYGIPDYKESYLFLKNELSINTIDKNKLMIYPNPVLNKFQIKWLPDKNYNFTIFDSSGKNVLNGDVSNSNWINVFDLAKGYYNLHLYDENGEVILPFLK